MASLLSNLVDNIAEGIHKIKGKYGHGNKKCKTCGIKYKDCVYCLKYTNKSYQKKFDENVKKRFASTYKFSNHDINKLLHILLLQKDLCPYEYADDWEKLMKHHNLRMKIFYSHINMEDISDADYMHEKEFTSILK